MTLEPAKGDDAHLSPYDTCAMARNVEIKARVADLAALEERVARIATAGPTDIRQEDTFFRVPNGRLKLRCDPDQIQYCFAPLGFARLYGWAA